MTPLERAEKIVRDHLRGVDCIPIEEKIRVAIVEATNDELEKRRAAERERDKALELLRRFNRAFSRWACGSEFHNEPERIAERVRSSMEMHREIGIGLALKKQEVAC